MFATPHLFDFESVFAMHKCCARQGAICSPSPSLFFSVGIWKTGSGCGGKCESHVYKLKSVDRRGSDGFKLSVLRSIGYSSHARHVSIWFGFPASYDEYPALVKFGNVASEHVRRAVRVIYLSCDLDTVTY